MSEPNRILIIGHSNIGDVCYDLVVVPPLRRRFPRAKITYMTSSRAAAAARICEGIDEVLTFDRKGKDRGPWGRIRLMARLWKRRFDFVVVLKDSVTHRFLGARRAWSVRQHLGSRLSGQRRHIVDSYLDFLRAHGLEAPAAEFRFAVGGPEREFSGRFFTEAGVSDDDILVGVLPLAAWSLKNWPVENWNELARRLRQQRVKVVAFGKTEDDGLGRHVLERLSPEIISAIDKTRLDQAIALIRRCRVFVGPDSSLLHLASCLGVETVGVYGPTPRDYIYPYFHREAIVATGKPFDCMPCYPGFAKFPCKGRFPYGMCMEALEVEEVLAMIVSRIKR